MSAADRLRTLNQEFLDVHIPKEDLVWSTGMALSDDRDALAAAENRARGFASDPERAGILRSWIQEADGIEDGEAITGLEGWRAYFEANAIEDASARKLSEELIEAETDIVGRHQQLRPAFADETGQTREGSLRICLDNIAAHNVESVRRSSHAALLGVEDWILDNGYLDLVRLRNRFARSAGYPDFFDYSSRRSSGLGTEDLFSLLNDFDGATAERNLASHRELSAAVGESALEPHNILFARAGDVERDLDPYVPFRLSLRRWIESFSRLGVSFADALLTLDLLDRKGKCPNGFMHCPVPPHFDSKAWVPARINFTSNAKPDQVGSGYTGLLTLFHEGGHAAHFANVRMNAPCFAQEFPPTTMPFVETQSMFFDNLLEDADWLKRYGRDNDGRAVPDELLRASTKARQPGKAFEYRQMMVVPSFERAVYALPDHELTHDRLKTLARDIEQRLLGVDGAPRPVMAFPHLLFSDAACAYQGYLLALMAVAQTRAWFLKRYGFLTDNPAIGPLMAEKYWAPGNSISHDRSLRDLTGEGFSARHLAASVIRSADEAWKEDEKRLEALADRGVPDVTSLGARIRICDGAELIADNDESDEKMCRDFETWIAQRYAVPQR